MDHRRGALQFFLTMLAGAFFLLPGQKICAATTDLWRGAAWSGTTGWIVMNCISDGSCAQNGYGVDVMGGDTISGWAWSSNIGWVCFGATCAGVAGNTPEGGQPYAKIDTLTHEVHGWALLVALGNHGWISLNCADMLNGCATYQVTADPQSGTVSGFGWNGNNDGTGIGWIDFSTSTLLGSETQCADGFDNDKDLLVDCADPDCAGQIGPATCVAPYVCGQENTALFCSDGCDNDGSGFVDCADPSCKANPILGCPQVETACADPGGAVACCSNNLDDDQNGLFDCADPDCFGVGACPSDEAHIASCQPATNCCSDFVNNDLKDPAIDCADASCSALCTGTCAADPNVSCIIDAQCPPDQNGLQLCNPTYFPWLQSSLSDVYGQKGLQATYLPPLQQYNATFCLLSSIGLVTNFVSDPSGQCTSPVTTGAVNAPASASGYANLLGQIPVDRIVKGLHGPVTIFSGDQTDLPGSGVLGGRVFVVEGNLTIANPMTFSAGAGGQSGAGLILVKGDLYIKADVTYMPVSTPTLSAIPSVGWIVLGSNGVGGNVDIDPSVTTFSGIVFAEQTFGSGTSGGQDVPLTVYGPVVAKAFDFERTFAGPLQGSEQILYDARSLLNPPPGLGDVTKALPRFELQ
jgi:hypothetical protein